MLMTAPKIETTMPPMNTLTSRMTAGSRIVNVRCTAVSLGYNIAFGIIGGPTPLTAA